MNPFPPQFGWLVYQAHLYIDIFTIKFLPYIHISFPEKRIDSFRKTVNFCPKRSKDGVKL